MTQETRPRVQSFAPRESGDASPIPATSAATPGT